MKMYSKTLPYGALPYEETLAAAKMIVKLFEKIPFMPCLAKLNDLSILERTLKDIPAVGTKDGYYVLLKDYERFKSAIDVLDEPYNTQDGLNKFCSYPLIWTDFLHIVKTSEPKQVVINLIGPMTLADCLKREEHPNLLSDKFGRKFLIQTVAVKAMSYIKQIKEVLPDINVLVVIEDNALSNLSQLRRENEDISNELVINVYKKIIDKIHETGASVCIQCFNKCDWLVPIEAGADMISFDAYNNPNNLCIIAEKVNEFLANGGYINWGIVPVQNDTVVKNLTIDYLYKKFQKVVENLINEGVDPRLAYNRATVSVQGNLKNLSIMFAEKALILSVQLGKKIPTLK